QYQRLRHSFRVATEPKYHRVFWYPGLAHHWAILLKHPLQDFGTSALNHRLLLRSKCPKDRDLVWAAESGTWPQRCQVAESRCGRLCHVRRFGYRWQQSHRAPNRVGQLSLHLESIPLCLTNQPLGRFGYVSLAPRTTTFTKTTGSIIQDTGHTLPWRTR